MNTKEWLMRAWKIDKEIDTLLEAKQKAFNRCVSTTVRPKEVSVSGGGGADPMVEYVRLEEKIDERVDELHRIKGEILDTISAVPDGTLRTLLIERYINFKTWEQIAVDMGYSWRQVFRLHGEALQEVKMS